MMEQLERFLLVASGDELTGKPSMTHHFQKDFFSAAVMPNSAR